MFAVEPKLLNRLQPHLRRVLILDPSPVSARMLADVVKALGAAHVATAGEERTGLELCRDIEFSLIFVESHGPALDGTLFTRKLRRGRSLCRQTPVIMVTAQATATLIKNARDAGVHEFVRKPYAAGDLLKRVEAACLKPRDWVEAVGYVGPDRRRFNSAEYEGPRKRKADASAGAGAKLEQAVRILRSAVAAYDCDPEQAERAIAVQAGFLIAMLPDMAELRPRRAIEALQVALADKRVPDGVAGPAQELSDWLKLEPLAGAA